MLYGNRIEKLSAIGGLIAISGGLYLSSLYSYLLFHSLIEIVTIAVAFTLFIITWNSRAYLANGYLRLLGTGYAFIALIDLAHTLAYKGMAIFPGYDANLPTQLWIAARYLQAATLLVAPLFLHRKPDDRAIFAGYALTVAGLLGLVFSGNFPDCFVEGKGLTPFKIASEYLITALLLGALYLLYRQRAYFKERVFALIAVSIVCTALSEMSFTAYASVYGLGNLVGHFAKLAAFYLIYRAILVTGFKEPFDLIFRDLKQVETDLWKSQHSLEDKVRERTAELRDSEEKYRSLIEKVHTAIVLHDGAGAILACNPMAEELLGLSAEQLRGKALIDPEWCFVQEDGAVSPVSDYPVGKVLATQQALRGHVMGVRRPDRGTVVWVLVDAEPEFDAAGKITRIIVSFVDVSQRKHAIEALHRINRELRAVSNCNQTLMHAEDEPSLLDAICRIVCHEAGYRMAWVGFAEHDAARTLRPVAWAGAGTGYLEQAHFTWADTEEGHAPSGKAVRSGESAGIADFASDPHAALWRQAALEQGCCSCIALPLKDEGGDSFGVLNIYAAQANAFTAEEQRLLSELAGDLAFGIVTLRTRAERKLAEEAEHRLNRELHAISKCNQTLMHATDEPTLLDDICRIVCDDAGYRMAWVGFAEHDEAKTLRHVAWAGAEAGYLDQAGLTWADTEYGHGPSGIAIRTGEMASIDDFLADPEAAPWRAAAEQRGYRASIALPLKDDNANTFGVLNIYSGEPHAFTAAEKRMLAELAGDLAFGITVLRARIKRQLAEASQQRLNRELRAISNCNQTLMRADNEQALLHDICHIVCNEAGYRMAWVGFAENDEAKTLRPVAWAGAETSYIELARLTWADTENGRRPSGIAVRRGEPAGIANYESEATTATWRTAAIEHGYRSSISLPLKDESAKTFGVLNIYSGLPNAFTPEETRLLEELAGDLAFGIMVLRARTERNQALDLIEKRIFALTRPMEDGSVTFDDLFNREEIQRIQDEFALATGVASLITKPDGTPLTAPSNFTPLCSEIIRQTERGALNCTRSDAALGCYHPEGPIVQPCLSGGLWDAGASITVGGRHIANWLIGQVRDETQTEEKMQAYARQIGADEAAYMAAFRKVPAMSRTRFEQVAQALFTLANQLSASAYQNVQQARFITERRVAEKEIEHLAFYDLLTQLPNRRLLMDRLQQAMADSGRNRHRGALLFIDLDNFKIINDTCGHDVGDQLLIDVADRLTTCVRDGDTVSRLGGDEFVVMLKDLGENQQEAAAQTKGVCEKILTTLNQPFTIGGHVHHSTASIGVTLFLDSDNPMDELLKQADIAMYQAKAAGRNTLRFFDPEMQAALAARADLETSLRVAILEQQFVLHYQPQVDAVRGIIGAEALVRWQQPAGGMVSPAQFIPLAEETGLILAIGQWVLEDACAQLRSWADDPLTRDLHLAVNVSARQFRQAEFVAQVHQVLASSGAPANHLKLELTESLVLDDVKDTIEKMQALKQLGVGFSMDDFGTGYSSLSYLTRLPLDQLKIDQSFVRNLPDNANDAVVAQTIITLAQSLGLGVIAEGVETEAQRQFLSEHGCPVFQGYLFSKPLPGDAFRKLLAST